jgi:threonine dehydrogenase-like Zn-dependent dehydrogenase
VVEEVGEEVTSVSPGDNVALLGQERFSQYTIAREEDTAKFFSQPSNWSGWIAEPIACCVAAVDMADVRPDDNVAVVGAGFMGLGVIQCLSLSLAGVIVAIAPRHASLDRAVAAGAHHGLRTSDPELIYKAAKLARKRPMPTQYLGPNVEAGPYDVAFEASGTEAGMEAAASLLRVGGTLVLVGHQRGRVAVDGTAWHMKGLCVLNASPMGSPDFAQHFQRTVGLLDRGRLNVASLVTHEDSFEHAQRLFEASSAPEYVKGVIHF